jgi:hypothetical protein
MAGLRPTERSGSRVANGRKGAARVITDNREGPLRGHEGQAVPIGETEGRLCIPEAVFGSQWDIGSIGMSHENAYVFSQHISFRRGTRCFTAPFALMTI